MPVAAWIVISVCLSLCLGAAFGVGTTRFLASRAHRLAEQHPTLHPAVTDVLQPLDTFAVVLNDSLSVVYANPTARNDPRVSGEQLLQPSFLRRAHRVLATGMPETQEPGHAGPEDTVRLRIARVQRRYLVVFADDVGEAQRLNDMRRDFIANVSHELKTPISAIGLLADAVLEAAEEPEFVRTFAGRLGKEAKRLGDLSRDVIHLSEAQQSLDPERLELIDLASLAQAELDAHQEFAAQQGVQLELQRKVTGTPTGAITLTPRTTQPAQPAQRAQPAHCIGDPARLGSVIANLVSNAIRHSPAGSIVTIELGTGASQHALVVTDHGDGIAAEHLPRIFERFYRVDPARSRASGGTGLGLAIVKHTVLEHGGDIDVRSEVGAGTRFTVTLPVADPALLDEPMAGARKRAKNATAATPGSTKPKKKQKQKQKQKKEPNPS